MTNRFFSLVAVAGIALAGAACESTGGNWGASNQSNDPALTPTDNPVPNSTATNTPLPPARTGSVAQPSDPGNFKQDLSAPNGSSASGQPQPNDPGNFKQDLSAPPNGPSANERP